MVKHFKIHERDFVPQWEMFDVKLNIKMKRFIIQIFFFEAVL